jgi:small subunit ribosomal protein S7
MPRRREVAKREILPDPKFNDIQIAKFMNIIMESGKKAVAENIVYGALDRLAQKTGADAAVKFQEILEKVGPVVELKARRVGGATYQVPVEVREDRRIGLAMRWLRDAARKRGEKGMMLRLAGEMTDALENRGAAMKKREETHRMAEANKAFAHFRW